MTRILCFGDSITLGVGDPDGGWTQRLSRALENIYIDEFGNRRHQVYNLGINGDDSSALLRRIEHEIESRKQKDMLIIIAIGTNDSLYFQESNNQIDPDAFGENLNQLINISRQYTDKLIILGTIPCIESKMQPMPWSMTKKCYSNQRLSVFNKVSKQISEKNSVIFEDLFSAFKQLSPENYLHDGLHPNQVGHQYICDRIKKTVAGLANNYQ